MALFLFAALIGVPIVEIAIFIQAGDLIGLWPTLAAVILTAIIGTALMRRQGLSILVSANQTLSEGRVPVAEAFDGICVVLAGALLLTPGFLTDAVGLALLTPSARRLLRVWLVLWLQKSGKVKVWTNDHVASDAAAGRTFRHPGQTAAKETIVIDGEYEPIAESNDQTDKDRKPRSG